MNLQPAGPPEEDAQTERENGFLSKRERQCLTFAARGFSNREIAQQLALSDRTVNEYIERTKRKLDVFTRVEAIVMAIKTGLIEV